jgi:trans-aconitate methyltransferase
MTDAAANFRETSCAFNASLDKQTRLDQGIFFTPKKARDALFERLKGIRAETILEPSFGTGELILDARVAFPGARIVGVEKNADLYNSVLTTVDANIDVHNADFLEWTGELVDLIIGNPPYFVIPKDKRYLMMTGRPNIYILFLYKCLTQHLKPDGVLAFVIPTSIYNCSYYQPMRDYIRNHCEVLYVETLDKPGFFETGQETTLLIIKNTPTIETANKYLYQSKTGKTFISPYAEELYQLTEKTETLASLGIGVKTGSIVWNQIPDNMADQGTLLIHASNISNSELKLDNISKKTKKRQYVTGVDKPTIDGPVILTDRGYGNKFKLNAALVDLRGFYAENHINVIYHKAPDHQTAQILARVLASFRDERTARFIQLFIGNGSMSATDLETIIPIF